MPPIGEHPTLGGPVTVKQGRFGPYVNHSALNATLPKGVAPDTLTMDQALAALAAKAAGVIPGARSLGEHPEGGVVTVRSGRFGPYVNWDKVNANIPKSRSPDTLTLNDALELLAEREGKPVKIRAAAKAKSEPATKEKAPPAKKKAAPAKKAAGKTAGK